MFFIMVLNIEFAVIGIHFPINVTVNNLSICGQNYFITIGKTFVENRTYKHDIVNKPCFRLIEMPAHSMVPEG